MSECKPQTMKRRAREQSHRVVTLQHCMYVCEPFRLGGEKWCCIACQMLIHHMLCVVGADFYGEAFLANCGWSDNLKVSRLKACRGRHKKFSVLSVCLLMCGFQAHHTQHTSDGKATG